MCADKFMAMLMTPMQQNSGHDAPPANMAPWDVWRRHWPTRWWCVAL